MNAFLSQQHSHTPGERRLLRENPEQTDLGAHRGRRAAYVQKLRRWKIDPLLQSESWKKVNIDSAPHKMGGFRVSCSPGWRQIYYVDKNSLEPLVLLPLSPNSLNCRHDSMPGTAFKILLLFLVLFVCVPMCKCVPRCMCVPMCMCVCSYAYVCVCRRMCVFLC